MKKLVAGVIAVIMLVSFCSVGFAEELVTVKINDQVVDFTDENGNIVPAQIINDRTMVPMRKTFELLGATVNWFEAEEAIVATTRDGKIITMKIGAEFMVVADISKRTQEKITLEVPAMIVNDRTLIPARAIAESLGYNVDWDEATQTVLISK